VTIEDLPTDDLRSESLHYSDIDTALTGTLYRDESRTSRRPGILLVHGGAGLDEHAHDQARRYAALGHVVLACDMYGDAVGDRERIMGFLMATHDDPALLTRRTQAGLTALAEHPDTDGRFAAVGFCLGGTAALALARAGANLAAAVSVHGTLTTKAPAAPGSVRARLLVCHGAADPHVPLTQVTEFADEMNAAGADWQLVMYGGAQHGFTHTRAAPGTPPGIAYDPVADARSFAAVHRFLADVFTDQNSVSRGGRSEIG
jgi:dienelactone hydrolase